MVTFEGVNCGEESNKVQSYTLSVVHVVSCHHSEEPFEGSKSRTSCAARATVDPSMEYYCSSGSSNANVACYKHGKDITYNSTFKDEEEYLNPYPECILYVHKVS